MWSDLVGQERAVATLARAAARPVHAYLLVGPRGSGVEEGARGFAARLVGADARAEGLARRGVHPDIVEFEPGGAQYKVDDVRDRVLPEAHRAPVEGDRKVLIVHEAEKLCTPIATSGNALLKTLEEPPARTVLVLVSSSPDELLPTISSRCQRIDFDPVSDGEIAAALRADGVPDDRATTAAALAGGQLARARALAGPLEELRAVFAAAPTRLDGTGARALAVSEDLDAAVEAAAAHVAAEQAAELAEFDAEMERHGYDERAAQRMRRQLLDRHKRAGRRLRIDLLLEGITAIESVYRDSLAAPAPALNRDRPVAGVAPRHAAEALRACRDAREAFVVNEKGLLRLLALLLALPPVSEA
jgi:DNA polymerase-3 subunit delta'